MSKQLNNFVDLNETSPEREGVDLVLSLDINQFPEFQKIHFLERDAARYSLNSMQEAFRKRFLNLSHFRNVADFGAGSGGPSLVLERICQIAGGKLVALEQHKPGIANIRRLSPTIPIHEGDGIDYLNGKNSEIDLIVAFKLGPDYHAKLFQQLANVSGKALCKNGRLLIYSDTKTISAVRFRISHLDVNTIPESNKGDTYRYIPETIILSKKACLSVSLS